MKKRDSVYKLAAASIFVELSSIYKTVIIKFILKMFGQ